MPRTWRALAVAAGSGGESLITDAAGPDTFTFEELLWLLAKAVNARVRLVHTSPSLGFAPTGLVGLMLRDLVHTRDGNCLAGSAPRVSMSWIIPSLGLSRE